MRAWSYQVRDSPHPWSHSTQSVIQIAAKRAKPFAIEKQKRLASGISIFFDLLAIKHNYPDA